MITLLTFRNHTVFGPCLYILFNQVLFDPVLNLTTASTVHSKYFYFLIACVAGIESSRGLEGRKQGRGIGESV